MKQKIIITEAQLKKIVGVLSESEIDIDEQISGLVKKGKTISTELKTALNAVVDHSITTRNRIKATFKNKSGSTFVKEVSTGDELLKALRAGGIDSANMAKIHQGLLKATSTPKPILDDLARGLVISNEFRVAYKDMKYAGEFKQTLLNKGYSDDAVESMMKLIEKDTHWKLKPGVPKPKPATAATPKPKKGATPAATTPAPAGAAPTVTATNPATNAAAASGLNTQAATAAQAGHTGAASGMRNAANSVGRISRTTYEKIKTVASKLNKKWLLYLGLAAGGVLAWKYFFGDKSAPEEFSFFDTCIDDIMDDDGVSVGVTRNGDPVVIAKKTGNAEYDSKGGLLFFHTKRVSMGDGSKKGTWSCNVGKIDINEQSAGGALTQDQMTELVDTAVSALDGFVSVDDLQTLKNVLNKLKGKTYKGQSATTAFADLYRDDEGGDEFISDVNSVGVRTLGVKGIELKKEVVALAQRILSVRGDGNKSTGIGNISIVWDGEKQTSPAPENGGGGGGTAPKPKPKQQSKYRPCNELPFTFGCKNEKIKELQVCLGLEGKYQTGNFGPITQDALKKVAGDGWDGKITQEIIDAICKNKAADDDADKGAPTEPIEPIEPLEPKGTSVDYGKSDAGQRIKPVVPNGETTTKTGKEVFDDLRTKKDGSRLLLKDISGRYKYKERFPGGQRLVPKAELDKLTEYLEAQGYRLFKSKDKDYNGKLGEKYVWSKDGDR